jgi:mannosyltransferase OCH1-like enzyme
MGKPMPDKYKTCIDSFKVYNPDWKVIVWNEEKFDKEFGDAAKKYKYENFKYAVQKFDLFRLLILDKYGGVYLDTDMLTIKSFNIPEILTTKFFAGFEKMRKPEYCHTTHNIKPGYGVNNAVIGCEPGNEVINYMLRHINILDFTPYEPDFRVAMGPKLIEKAVKILGYEAYILDEEYFFPIPYFEEIRHNKVSGKTVAIHLYDGGQDGY